MIDALIGAAAGFAGGAAWQKRRDEGRLQGMPTTVEVTDPSSLATVEELRSALRLTQQQLADTSANLAATQSQLRTIATANASRLAPSFEARIDIRTAGVGGSLPTGSAAVWRRDGQRVVHQGQLLDLPSRWRWASGSTGYLRLRTVAAGDMIPAASHLILVNVKRGGTPPRLDELILIGEADIVNETGVAGLGRSATVGLGELTGRWFASSLTNASDSASLSPLTLSAPKLDLSGNRVFTQLAIGELDVEVLADDAIRLIARDSAQGVTAYAAADQPVRAYAWHLAMRNGYVSGLRVRAAGERPSPMVSMQSTLLGSWRVANLTAYGSYDNTATPRQFTITHSHVPARGVLANSSRIWSVAERVTTPQLADA